MIFNYQFQVLLKKLYLPFYKLPNFLHEKNGNNSDNHW